MPRLLAALLAALLLLAAAPAAGAAVHLVNDGRDDSDLNPLDRVCDTDGGGDATPCTLRAAIEQANADAGTDTVDLRGFNDPIAVATTLTAGPGAALLLDDGGAEVRLTGPAGPLLLFAPTAGGSRLDGLRLSGDPGSGGALLRVEASGFASTGATVTGARGDGVQVAGTANPVTFGSLTVTGSSGAGILLADSARNVALNQPLVAANAGDGVRMEAGVRDAGLTGGSVSQSGGDGIDAVATRVTINGTRISGNAEAGVEIGPAGQVVNITRSPVFSNSLAPVFLATGANGGIEPPQGLRVGPRRADGSLPLTGGTSTGGGTVEVFSGDPAGPTEIAFLGDAPAGPGGFSFLPAPEPAPGSVLAATLRDERGTSAFATALVPGDIASPALADAVATSLTEVRVRATEPLDPATVDPADFVLDMAGQRRAVSGVSLSPDRTEVVLASSGWTHGEAGFVELAAPGAVSDTAGNASLAPARLRVRAAPGDLLAPVASSLSIRPRRICLRRGPGCRRTGARVTFLANEPGRARLVIMRGNRRIGVDEAIAVGGRNTVRFNGKLGNRRLRPGNYRMLLYLEDQVGNETIEPPIQLFTIEPARRAAGSRR
ncbi:MAG TPA: right-handed parallel beta-helix repeat-containing protein [Thermoleophilaceae bacterium]|nr:right-handed parallel beta-helix repeat-containing protein [Thermoleophilaceae bacterium]